VQLSIRNHTSVNLISILENGWRLGLVTHSKSTYINQKQQV